MDLVWHIMIDKDDNCVKSLQIIKMLAGIIDYAYFLNKNKAFDLKFEWYDGPDIAYSSKYCFKKNLKKRIYEKGKSRKWFLKLSRARKGLYSSQLQLSSGLVMLVRLSVCLSVSKSYREPRLRFLSFFA